MMSQFSSIIVVILSCLVGLSFAKEANKCNYNVVESMPEGLTFETANSVNTTPTADALLKLIRGAEKSIKIASFYWTMTDSKPSETYKGNENDLAPAKEIMNALQESAKRGVKIEIVTDKSNKKSLNYQPDLDFLSSFSDVKYLDMQKLFKAGVLHTKFVIADSSSYYLGSSNMDWRSYTHIKEIGIMLTDCPVLAQDLEKIFRTYQIMADSDTVPDQFPAEVNTTINMQNPLELTSLGPQPMKVFQGASPPPFNGKGLSWTGRTDDIDGLVEIIKKAKKYVYISVMKYSPVTEFMRPRSLWPNIDHELRKAAIERNVEVKILLSNWTHSGKNDPVWYESLDVIRPHWYSKQPHGGIQVNLFTVPVFNEHQRLIPFARVKHDKYMVSDYGVYIGTSNWTPDYFITTAGVGFVAIPEGKSNSGEHSLRNDMKNLFERDFNSAYSVPVSYPLD